MLVFRRAPKNVASVELQLWAAFNLRPTHAFGDDQRLSEGMGMPCSTGARFEVNDRPTYSRWHLALELARDGGIAGEILGGARDSLQSSLRLISIVVTFWVCMPSVAFALGAPSASAQANAKGVRAILSVRMFVPG